MKRRYGAIAIVIAALGAVYVWRCHGEAGGTAPAAASSTAGAPARAPGAADPDAHKDPRTLARASISGTITDEAKAPIAHARVCVDASSRELPDDLVRDPICIESDAAGHYKAGNLLAADYTVAAMARTYRPATFHRDGNRERLSFRLQAGEAKTGVDLALRAGGVEITGIVNDISGGPVAHAQVRASESWTSWSWSSGGQGVTVDADDHGHFSLWVKPGTAQVTAHADGYAPGEANGPAPGTFEIFLTPAASLSGSVVDAGTNRPIEGARVSVSRGGSWGADGGDAAAISDADGKFRVTRLRPGRYVATVQMEHGYGRTEGSTLVGLGQHVDGVVVRVFPAHRIDGMVVLVGTKDACPDGGAYFHNAANNDWITTEREEDGTVHADGVVPGTYTVHVMCKGYQSRDRYDEIAVTDKDVTGLRWEVDAGARIRGKVVSKAGAPIEQASVSARTTGGAARDKTARGHDQSTREGTYELSGLPAGTYKLDVDSDRGVAPKDGYEVTVAAGTTVERDLVLDDAGAITGTVVDTTGKPIGGAQISAYSTTDNGWFTGDASTKSDDAGAFTLEGIGAGDYRVTAAHGWSDELKKPGTTADEKQGEKTTVRAGETSTVRLVVESQSGVIKGSVVDAAGKPVNDAFISAARESDAAGSRHSSVEATRWGDWDAGSVPVLTNSDGTFAVTRLAPGSYSLRAYRKGGGEAVAEHVSVGTTTRLQIKPTGSIDGTATRDGGPVSDEITLTIQDLNSGFVRIETFYKTSGHFIAGDLPAGHFHVALESEGAQKSIELDLAEGEAKTGVVIALDTLVTLTGRIVDLATKQPVPAMRVFARLAQGGGFSFTMTDAGDNVTDESGRFTLKNAARGRVAIKAMPKDFGDDGEYGFVYALRTVTGTGTVDVGDISAAKKRVKKGDPVGNLGIHWAERPNDMPPDQAERKVSFIEPAGPAAKTKLKVGDIVTSVDGVDCTGPNFAAGWTLMQVPPGTKVTLGVARGASISIIAAAP